MTSHILTVKNLSVRFGGIHALQDINFEIKAGGISAIIGPNGAGKTTVFNCLSGFYRATSGDIFFSPEDKVYALKVLLGEKIHPADFLHPVTLLRKLRYKMFGGSHLVAAYGLARTFQNIRLFAEMTVVENLLVAQHRRLKRGLFAGVFNTPAYRRSEEHAIAEAYAWLERLQLTPYANRLASELSYGLQRRLEIARAMCTGAKLLCLDEPAAGLNHRETAELAGLIKSLRDDFNTTILLIEHDMSLVMKISDHVVVLDHGQVIASGTPDQIKKDPKVLAAYLGEEELP